MRGLLSATRETPISTFAYHWPVFDHCARDLPVSQNDNQSVTHLFTSFQPVLTKHCPLSIQLYPISSGACRAPWKIMHCATNRENMFVVLVFILSLQTPASTSNRSLLSMATLTIDLLSTGIIYHNSQP